MDRFVAAISDVARAFAVGVPQGLEFFMPFETMVELSVDNDKTITPLLPPSTRIIAIVSLVKHHKPLSSFVKLPPKSPSGVTYSRLSMLSSCSPDIMLEIGNPLPCRTTYQKLAASCSEARPKYVSIYTGNERAILLFLLFESAVLVLLAGLVRFCCIFWRKKKLQGQDLGKFLEKRVSL
ncbi:Protein gamete expressed 3 [Vitis vinifera]|uniref:Protein gamete expressed 3 n=1 Tax=Vitis vinifera TaxID=29760 RepID=A0A438EAL5_VITVI|nr:Protein gamete expressed 3 [Vitis vinifera]